MKTSLVLTLLGCWLAFLTVMQSFQAWDRLLYANNFSMIAWTIGLIAMTPIAFGYTVFLEALVAHRRPRRELITITLAVGVVVVLMFALMSTRQRAEDPLFLSNYIKLDQYLRTRHQTVITYMDYGNSLLLLATGLWWGLTGIVLLLLPRTRRRQV